MHSFHNHCVVDIESNFMVIEKNWNQSMMLVTVFEPTYLLLSIFQQIIFIITHFILKRLHLLFTLIIFYDKIFLHSQNWIQYQF